MPYSRLTPPSRPNAAVLLITAALFLALCFFVLSASAAAPYEAIWH